MARRERDNKKNKQEYMEVKVGDNMTVRMYDPGKDDTARASLTVDVEGGPLVVYGNAVNGRNGWFFSYPQYKDKQGNYKNLVFALNRETNEAISNALEDAADNFGAAN